MSMQRHSGGQQQNGGGGGFGSDTTTSSPPMQRSHMHMNRDYHQSQQQGQRESERPFMQRPNHELQRSQEQPHGNASFSRPRKGSDEKTALDRGDAASGDVRMSSTSGNENSLQQSPQRWSSSSRTMGMDWADSSLDEAVDYGAVAATFDVDAASASGDARTDRHTAEAVGSGSSIGGSSGVAPVGASGGGGGGDNVGLPTISGEMETATVPTSHVPVGMSASTPVKILKREVQHQQPRSESTGAKRGLDGAHPITVSPSSTAAVASSDAASSSSSSCNATTNAAVGDGSTDDGGADTMSKSNNGKDIVKDVHGGRRNGRSRSGRGRERQSGVTDARANANDGNDQNGNSSAMEEDRQMPAEQKKNIVQHTAKHEQGKIAVPSSSTREHARKRGRADKPKFSQGDRERRDGKAPPSSAAKLPERSKESREKDGESGKRREPTREMPAKSGTDGGVQSHQPKQQLRNSEQRDTKSNDDKDHKVKQQQQQQQQRASTKHSKQQRRRDVRERDRADTKAVDAVASSKPATSSRDQQTCQTEQQRRDTKQDSSQVQQAPKSKRRPRENNKSRGVKEISPADGIAKDDSSTHKHVKQNASSATPSGRESKDVGVGESKRMHTKQQKHTVSVSTSGSKEDKMKHTDNASSANGGKKQLQRKPAAEPTARQQQPASNAANGVHTAPASEGGSGLGHGNSAAGRGRGRSRGRGGGRERGRASAPAATATVAKS